MSGFAAIEHIADALFYEGYMLYPYRLSSIKNTYRWNFGVLYPGAFAKTCGERSFARTECLLEASHTAKIDVKARFLKLTKDTPEERTVCIWDLVIADLIHAPRTGSFPIGDEAGVLSTRAIDLGDGLTKIVVEMQNLSAYAGDDRQQALERSLISTHFMLSAPEGRFISLVEFPERFQEAVSSCENQGLWPVLADKTNTTMLAAPIIISDYPAVAPRSAGNFFDSTEIDEILTLRIRTLTDNEKDEMRNVDQRTCALLERSEGLSEVDLLNLHAAMQKTAAPRFNIGDSVRLRPTKRADAFDILLDGKLATVISVEHDIDGGYHVCVTIDEDPGKDLGAEGKPGHRFFFGAGELEFA